jgi:hypothetical protein
MLTDHEMSGGDVVLYQERVQRLTRFRRAVVKVDL